MTGKSIKMKIRSTRYEMKEFLFAEMCAELAEEIDIPEDVLGEVAEGETIEIATDGILTRKDGRVELSYDETELTGMEGSRTAVSFSEDAPELITMVREGTVSTALVFEPNKRHHCVYKTPYMPFEVCVRTLKVDNKLENENKLFIDYIIEIRGAKAERTKFELTYFE